ncbi:MAG: CheR family methyltransferase [Planctomycetota bacterium]
MLSDAELDLLSGYAHEKWGLVINEKKRVIVENRIAALRRSDPSVDDVSSLIKGLRNDSRPKLELALFDVLSTNHTHFFREADHLDLLKKEVLEPAKAARKKGLRIWSAGCSRGCEPYSLSIVMREVFGDPAKDDHRILATDLSTGALRAAREGLYSGIELEGLDKKQIERHFTHAPVKGRDSYRIDPSLAGIVSFGRLNLLERWPMKGPFDAILCRNVMIYFDAATRESLARRFLGLIRPGGYLMIGTSETLADFDVPAEALSSSVYRKPGGAR